MLQNPSSNLPPFISLELDFKGGRRRNWRNKRGKKYAKTVEDEEERKMEFSSYLDESDEFREGEGESDFDDAEDRICQYDPSKGSNKREMKKEYIIDDLLPDIDNSSKISSKPNKHKRKSSGLIEPDFMGVYQNDLKEEEKHVMVSDKYSCDIEQEHFRSQNNKYKEEVKEISQFEHQDEDRIKPTPNIKVDNPGEYQKDSFKVTVPNKNEDFVKDDSDILSYQKMKDKIRLVNSKHLKSDQNM